ncbi:MAG: DUF4838 domain-containing protein [Pirellulales bacterium]|nr:DUF4838 domain-containing protein [Pirellulales bacterium]
MLRLSYVACSIVFFGMGFFSAGDSLPAQEPLQTSQRLKILDKKSLDAEPPIYTACYSHPSGVEMIGLAHLSSDGGQTWKPFTTTPDFTSGLPYGYRREPFPPVLDPRTGKIAMVYNALDTPGLDPNLVEPPIALKSYYLRYRVSLDAGRTYLFDEPVVQANHTPEHPFDGVWKGKNAICFGDIGSLPIFNRRGEILAPAGFCPLGPDGKLYNPGGGNTYSDVLVLIGKWQPDHRLSWEISQPVKGDPHRTLRGLPEPTLAELPDGRILMIARGSNRGRKDGNKCTLPSYKWQSVSEDGGRSWSAPKPWTYDNGKPFFSPSSMSHLFAHSSGRIFWIGNISPENCQGNHPRWPLVIGEVDRKSLNLIEESVLTVDTYRDEDAKSLPLALSHFRVLEDRRTGEILLIVPRDTESYKVRKWFLYRLGASDVAATALPLAKKKTSIIVNFGRYESAKSAADGEAAVNWSDGDPRDDTACTESFAARELQRCLRKMLPGNPEPAIHDDAAMPAGDLILVGGPGSNQLSRSWLEKLRVTEKELSDLGDEGYCIKSAEVDGRKVVLIAGGGRIGTLYGAYDFLYRLGCRWFAPGELHEDLPRIENLGQWDVKERPSFGLRGYYVWEDRGTPEFFLWMARNRMNYWWIGQSGHPLLHKLGIRLVAGFHDAELLFLSPFAAYPYNHSKWKGDESLPVDPYPPSTQYAGDADGDGKLSYFEAHPEWYYYNGRKRVPGMRLPEHGANYCTSNEHATAEFMKNYLQSLIDGPYRDAQIVRFMTLDGGEWCQCESCRSLGAPTDRYLLLLNRLTEEVDKARAAGKIRRPLEFFFMIYYDVLSPPSRPLPPKFDETVIGMMFPIRRCYVHNFDESRCTINAEYRKQFEGWAVPGGHYRGQLAIGEYYNVSKYKCLPVCYMHSMASDIPFYYRLGARHFDYMHVTTAAWGSKALTNYQMARQTWNMKTDCPALWTDYFQRRYGPAAETMRAFYGSLEKMLCNVTELKYGLGPRLDQGKADLFPNARLRYSREPGVPCDGPTLLEMVAHGRDCRQRLNQALEMTRDDRLRRRIAEDESGFTYAERTLAYYQACVEAYQEARAGNRPEAQRRYDDARRLAELLKQDTHSAAHASSDANETDALTASRAKKALGRIAKLLEKMESPPSK